MGHRRQTWATQELFLLVSMYFCVSPPEFLVGIAFSVTLLAVLIACFTFKGLSHLDKCLAFLDGPLVQSPALTPPTPTPQKSSFLTV